MMTYKLVVMGNRGVGKSALTMRLLYRRFVPEYKPTIRNVYRVQLMVDGERCQLIIVDLYGGAEYQDLRQDCMMWGQGFLFVYTVDSIRTFVDVGLFWHKLQRVKGTSWVPMVLVANKVDLDHREVGSVLGREGARSFGAPYVETSAKSQKGVLKAFRELVREIRWFQSHGFQRCLVQECPEPEEPQEPPERQEPSESQEPSQTEQQRGPRLRHCAIL